MTAHPPNPVTVPVTVHGSAHARAALAAAADTGCAVEVWSAPGAALYLGVYWLPAVLHAAAAQSPGASWTGVLDCGDAPGLAVSALAAGIPAICLHDVHAEAVTRLRAIADILGARVLTARPQMTDLALSDDPFATCSALMATPSRSI